jgi:methylenetetrahydrofolate--tRNA-(uracil-5-)-methyltransferase
MIESNPLIEVFREEVKSVEEIAQDASAVVLATGPLTSDALAADIVRLTGDAQLAFYDAAAPIVMADSIDMTRAFKQSRYEQDAPGGDYINCPFTKEEYDQFIE